MIDKLPPTVLVVEHDAEFRVALADFLHDHGFRVWQATTATEALSRLREEGDLPQLLLIELGLQGMGGPALIEALRNSRAREVPVVALTGYDPVAVESVLRVPTVAKWQTDRLLDVLAAAGGKADIETSRAMPPKSRKRLVH